MCGFRPKSARIETTRETKRRIFVRVGCNDNREEKEGVNETGSVVIPAGELVVATGLSSVRFIKPRFV